MKANSLADLMACEGMHCNNITHRTSPCSCGTNETHRDLLNFSDALQSRKKLVLSGSTSRVLLSQLMQSSYFQVYSRSDAAGRKRTPKRAASEDKLSRHIFPLHARSWKQSWQIYLTILGFPKQEAPEARARGTNHQHKTLE